MTARVMTDSRQVLLLHQKSSRRQSLPMAVNWNNVTYMEKTFDGTIIHLSGGGQVESEEYLEEILEMLAPDSGKGRTQNE